jgi:sugar transferase (PEP-CTERM/EpsH1 system associated)
MLTDHGIRVLYVTPYVPSRIRTRPYHLLRALVDLGHKVHLLTVTGATLGEQGQISELQGWGIEVEAFVVPLWRSLANCLRALPTRIPLQAAYAYHPQMEQRLNQLSIQQTFDVIHIEHLRAAQLGKTVSAMPTVYDSVDSISLLFEQTMAASPQWRSRWMARVDLERTRRYEARLLTHYDQVVVTSDRDRNALEKLAHRYLPAQTRTAPISVVTNGVDLEYFAPTSEIESQGDVDGRPPTIVLTGKMSYHANVASALYFARQVLPDIWKSDARVRFQIVGKDPPETIRQLAQDPRIEVTGYVEDLRPYLAQATAAVCPARYAVGVQNKVLEAMAMAKPVISTPEGCAALNVHSGRELLIAQGKDELADAVLQILSDPIQAARLSASGRRYVELHHNWKASARRLAEVYERISRQ